MGSGIVPHQTEVAGSFDEQNEEMDLQSRISILQVMLILVIVICLACLGSFSLERVFSF